MNLEQLKNDPEFCKAFQKVFAILQKTAEKDDKPVSPTRQIVLTIENGKLTPESEILVGTLFHPDGEIVKTMDEILLTRIARWALKRGDELHYLWAGLLEEECKGLNIWYNDERGIEYESGVKLMLKAQKMVDETSGQEDWNIDALTDVLLRLIGPVIKYPHTHIEEDPSPTCIQVDEENTNLVQQENSNKNKHEKKSKDRRKVINGNPEFMKLTNDIAHKSENVFQDGVSEMAQASNG